MADTEAERRAQQAICEAFAVQPHVIGLKPRPARLRFRLVRCVDHVAVWLGGHGHDRAAVRLWRLSGLW
jgi:hypothetical protein